MSKNKSLEWAEIVAKSGGSRIMFPEAFKEEYKKHEERNNALQNEALAFNKRKAATERENDDFWFRVRQELEKQTGKIEIWTQDFGLDQDAKKDGVMILNVREKSN